MMIDVISLSVVNHHTGQFARASWRLACDPGVHAASMRVAEVFVLSLHDVARELCT